MSEKREYPGGIPRRIYRLPKREVDRMIEEAKGGFDGDGKGVISFYHPINPSPKLLNDETLAVQLKLTIGYKERSIFIHGKSLKKRGVKATYTYPIANLERMEIVPEGLLLVPHGSPYESNPDLLIVPDDGVERMCIYEICPLMVGDEWPDCKTCPYADGTEGDERMTDDTLMLTFPKDKTEEIMLQGIPFIRVDTGMTIESFMWALMKYSTSGKKGIGVIREIPSSGICDVFEPRGEEENGGSE